MSTRPFDVGRLSFASDFFIFFFPPFPTPPLFLFSFFFFFFLNSNYAFPLIAWTVERLLGDRA